MNQAGSGSAESPQSAGSATAAGSAASDLPSLAQGLAGAPAAQRLLSVDVARGLTLMLMVIVNNQGDWDHVYRPLEHSAWHGFTPTDFVFPNFLFIAGMSIAFALSRKREAGLPHGRILLQAARRCAILFLIGVGITAFVINFDFAHLRIPGVLQRIAVVSFLGSFLFLKLGNRALARTAFGLLALYYVLLNFVPVPGHGPANLDPETHLGAWLDRLIFTTDHLYRHTRTWDPEGLLSTLPSISTGLFGILAGLALLKTETTAAKLKRFLGIGSLFVLAGVAAHPFFPINKCLWTSSFVLLTSGLSMIFIGLCWWAVDVRGWRKGTGIAVAFGVNSIFAYLCEELFPTVLDKLPAGGGQSVVGWIYKGAYVPIFGPTANASLAWALTMLAVITPVLLWLRRRKVLIKI